MPEPGDLRLQLERCGSSFVGHRGLASEDRVCFANAVGPSGLPQRVADVAVAVDARGHVAVRAAGQHLVDEIGMAVEAGILRHASIAGFDLDRLVEVLQRERQRVEEAVVALGDPLAERVWGKWQSLQTATWRWLDFCHES